MVVWRVIAGIYHHDDGKVYGKDSENGATFEDDRPMDKLFKNKFERVEVVARPKKKAQEEDEEDEEDEIDTETEETPKKKKKSKKKKDKEKSDTEEEDWGIEVTDQFQRAADAEATIYKGADGYTVVHDGKSVKTAIKDKKSVNRLLRKMLK